MKFAKFILIPFIFFFANCNIAAKSPEIKYCQDKSFENNSYTICQFNISNGEISLFLKNDIGEIIGDFNRLNQFLKTKNKQLVFAMNAGMYNESREPIGLFISNGMISKPLFTKDSSGNFGLKPNGVFYINGNIAGILETNEFAKKFENKNPELATQSVPILATQSGPMLATQSGPMLVINNQIHPKFIKNSANLNLRNGVGVSEDGKTIFFVISNDFVNFESFARLFKDELKTPNALYLDGSISKLYSKELKRNDKGDKMGPIIGFAN